MTSNENTDCAGEHVLVPDTTTEGNLNTYTCLACGQKISVARSVSDDFVYCWDAQKVKVWDNATKSHWFYNSTTVDGETYVSCTPKGTATIGAYPVENVTTPLGKYLAVKYRITPTTEETSQEMRFFVKINGITTEQYVGNAITNDWVVVAIDISGFDGYEENKASTSFNVEFTYAKATLDLAYIVMFDNLTDIYSRLGDGESCVFRGTHIANEGVAFDKNGVHDNYIVVTDTQTTDNAVTYSFTCAICGHQLSAPKEVPNDVFFWYPPTSVYCYDNNRDDPKVWINRTASEGEVFVRAEPQGNSSMGIYPFQEHTSPRKKYLAIKYRSFIQEGHSSSIQLPIQLGDNSGLVTQQRDNAATGDWVITVIDISGLPGYTENAEFKQNAISMTVRTMTDLAYIAMFDNLEDIYSLLDENETYINCGTSFSNAGIAPTIAEKLALIDANQREIFDEGKRAEYDAFCDAFQNQGQKTWNDFTFAEKWFTNGKVYGRIVYLGVSDSNENWYEISEEEYQDKIKTKEAEDIENSTI